jgi:hypothetical protein
MRRLIWVAVGVGLSVAAYRWVRKQQAKYGPEAVAAKLSDGARDAWRLLEVSVNEGRRAAAEKEAEIRASLEERDRE